MSRRDPLITTGEDAFGAFEVRDNYANNEPELCISTTSPPKYDHVPKLMLVYLDTYPILPSGIKIDHTILKRPDAAIGIDCGCYARFQRQIAHVRNAMKGRTDG